MTALSEQSLADALNFFREQRASMPLGAPTSYDLLCARRMEAGLPTSVVEAYLFVHPQNIRDARRIQAHQRQKDSFAAGRRLARYIWSRR